MAEVHKNRHALAEFATSRPEVLPDADPQRVAEEGSAAKSRAEFLISLFDCLRTIEDPLEIQRVVAHMVGERLATTHAYYSSVSGESAHILYDYVRGDTPSLVGEYALSDFGSTVELTRDAPLVISDMRTTDALPPHERETWIAVGIHAIITAPVHKGDLLVGSFAVSEPNPRSWSADDVELVVEVSERTWDAIDRARAEAALRASEEKYRSLISSMNEGFALCQLVRNDDGRAVGYRYLEVNTAFTEVTGLSYETIIGRDLSELFPDPYREWLDFYTKVVETGVPSRTEQYFEPLNRWYAVWAFPRGNDTFGALFDDVTERYRAEAELEKSRRRFALLSNTNSLLLTTQDPEAEIQVIGERLTKHLDADVFFNYVFDEGVENLRLNAYGGVEASVAKAISRLKPGQAICGCVARDGERIVSEDVQHNGDPRAELVRGMGVRCYACHPLKIDGRSIGTLSIGTKKKDTFEADELALMRTVADQISVAIQKARLLGAQRTRRRRVEALHAVLEAGVSSLDVRQSAQRILESLATHQEFDLASLWLLKDDTLEVAAYIGYSEEQAKAIPAIVHSDAAQVFRMGRAKVELRPTPVEVARFEKFTKRKLEAYMILPLKGRESNIGALRLVWARKVEIDSHDMEFYESVADEVAVVLENAALYESEHRVAETLQEMLVVLPTELDGVSFSRAYTSATLERGRVGGDFVDIFEIGPDLVGISLGDVAGKGLEAAVTTSSVRTTLRVHAIDGRTPDVVVGKANDVLRRLTSVEEYVTLWFGVLNTETGHLRYVGAGHPPALVLSADGSLEELACKDPIVGAFDGARFQERRTVLTPGDRLILYSDGATEARSPEGVFLGEAGLRDVVRRQVQEPTMTLAPTVMREIVEHCGGVLRDDVALLVVEATRVR